MLLCVRISSLNDSFRKMKICPAHFCFISLAVCILFAQVYYNADLIRRSSASAELIVLMQIFRHGFKDVDDTAKKQALSVAMMKRIAKARNMFMSGFSYWKNIHESFFQVGVSYLYESKPLLAIKALKKCLKYHPYYMNAYHLLALIYEKDPLVYNRQKSESCMDVYTKILKGKKINKDAICDCVELKYCSG